MKLASPCGCPCRPHGHTLLPIFCLWGGHHVYVTVAYMAEADQSATVYVSRLYVLYN